MSTENSAQPNSLAGVAAARVREPGTAPLGSGLEARGVHAWFGSHHALENVSLDFAAGTVTALIGPSGCGKSTFIRTLNRMHEFIPSAAMAGEVLLAGKTDCTPRKDDRTPREAHITPLRNSIKNAGINRNITEQQRECARFPSEQCPSSGESSLRRLR